MRPESATEVSARDWVADLNAVTTPQELELIISEIQQEIEIKFTQEKKRQGQTRKSLQGNACLI